MEQYQQRLEPDQLEANKRRSRKGMRLAAVILAATSLASACSIDESAQAASNTDVVVGTWNVLYEYEDVGSKEEKIEVLKTGINQLLKEGHVQVLGLQEVTKGDYIDMIRDDILDCGTCTHDGFIAEKNHGSELPIIWDETTHKLSDMKNNTGQILVHGKKSFNDNGGGGEVINDRHIVWAIVEDLVTGKKVRFGNTHVLPSVSEDDRVKYFEKHIDKIEEFLNEELFDEDGNKIPSILMGDFNTNFRQDKYQELYAKLGLSTNWAELGLPPKGNTHGDATSDRIIDATITTDDGPQAVTSTKWTDHNGSDHLSLIVTYRLNETTGEFATDQQEEESPPPIPPTVRQNDLRLAS